MVVVVFVLCAPTIIAYDGGSDNIDVIRESHAERIFMRTYLTLRFLFIEVVLNFPYPPLFICRIYLTISVNIRNEVLLVFLLF